MQAIRYNNIIYENGRKEKLNIFDYFHAEAKAVWRMRDVYSKAYGKNSGETLKDVRSCPGGRPAPGWKDDHAAKHDRQCEICDS